MSNLIYSIIFQGSKIHMIRIFLLVLYSLPKWTFNTPKLGTLVFGIKGNITPQHQIMRMFKNSTR